MRTRQLYRNPTGVTEWLMIAALMLIALFFFLGCAAIGPLGRIIQPPLFEQADRPAEIRLFGPSVTHPAGGAGVTLWIDITNPNAFGFTVSTLDTTLLLEGQRGASGSFPLGLPLQAGQMTTVPLELSVSFADLPGMAGVLRQAVTGLPVEYQLEGTVGVDAGRFGRPTFGPMPLARGELSVIR